MSFHRAVTSQNIEIVEQQLRASQEDKLDFSDSVFDSSETIRKFCNALERLPQGLQVTLNNCLFKEDRESMMDLLRELRMWFATMRNIRGLEFTGIRFETVHDQDNSSARFMTYLVSGLCRNQTLRRVIVDGVLLNEQAVIDLKNILKEAIINGIKIQKHSDSFYQPSAPEHPSVNQHSSAKKMHPRRSGG